MEKFDKEAAILAANNKKSAMRKKLIISGLLFSCFFLSATFIVCTMGYMLCKPAKCRIENPGDEDLKNILISSGSGSLLHGWVLPGLQNHGVILLFHSLRSNRSVMLDRARMLSRSGYTALLFDFQAHGESDGSKITFGYRESKDVESIFYYAKSNYPNEKIGAIGISLGGAAILLRNGSTVFDALVIESVYPTIEEATNDRIRIRLGILAPILTPILLSQLKLQIGITAKDLRPIEKINKQQCPILLIAGKLDKHTTILESERMYAKAQEPKEYWMIPDAGHEDFFKKHPIEYREKILRFFGNFLRTTSEISTSELGPAVHSHYQ